MIGRELQTNCPVCGFRVKKPYLTSFDTTYSERRFYECSKCGKLFAILLDYKEGSESIEAD